MRGKIAALSCLTILVFGVGAWRVARAQTTAGTTDPLALALANAGMDPTQAQAWAVSTELTIAAQKAFVVSTNNAIAALQTSVSTLNSQLGIVDVRIAPPSRRSAIGYVIPVPGITLAGASQLPPSTSLPEGVLLGSAGNYYDYAINVPAAGQYSVSAMLAGAGTLAFHVEDPPGPTTLPQPLSTSFAGSSGWTVVTGPTLPLTLGPQIIRMVIDTSSGTFHLQWLYLTRQS
jgi:hypothetical protein